MRLVRMLLSGAALLVGGSVAFAAEEKPARGQNGPRLDPARLLEQFDKNKDGYLDRSEVPQPLKERFKQIDLDGDGKLSREELQKFAERMGKEASGRARPGGGRPGEVVTGAAKRERPSDKLKTGDIAPDFTLPLVAGKDKVTLSSFKGKRPVVLIFASYT